MANRDPKQCAKAVQGFWNNERDLIKQGLGTRNWSVQEQIEIMNFKPSGGERKNAAAPTYGQGEATEYGMSYDKYEGQHMKSAEVYPEFQSDPNNIQALIRNEHQQAHGGDFHNPTNGYYDPDTGQMTDFGDNPPTSLQPQQLSAAYVDTAEYQYILNSMDDQQTQDDLSTKEELLELDETLDQDIALGQDIAEESITEDALTAYEGRRAETQNLSDDSAQDILSEFEQNKAEMQNPTQDNYDNVLNDFDRKKSDMQTIDDRQDVSQDLTDTNEQTIDQLNYYENTGAMQDNYVSETVSTKESAGEDSEIHCNAGIDTQEKMDSNMDFGGGMEIGAGMDI